MRCLPSCALVGLLAVGSAEAATINVPADYATIQTAIDAASTGAEVVVGQGTYVECIDFKGKAITVRSTAPTDLAVVAATIIDGGAGGPVVTFQSSEGLGSVLAGLTITNGSANYGGGIRCRNSSPTISANTISGNSANYGGGIGCYEGSPTISGNAISDNSAREGGGIGCFWASPTISGNTISGNTASGGGGIGCYGGPPTISANTISGNSAREGGGIYCSNSGPSILSSIIAFSVSGGGLCVSGGAASVSYCDVYGNAGGDYVGMADPTGTNGNMSVDPLFANAAGGDFHLQSTLGRWDPVSSSWVTDAQQSPCIDAGDPTSDYGSELRPNGMRVNMGAYGNTAEASKSVADDVPPTAPSLVEVTPPAPGTEDDLRASASGATDPDGDTLTYHYEWSKTTDGGASWSQWTDREELDKAAADGSSGNVLDHRLTAKGEEWKARARAYDGVLYGSWAESAAVTIGNSAPTLGWLGVPGFLADGHDPGAGAPDSAEFEFRVKITDPDDTAPADMTVEVQRVEDCRNWVSIGKLPLSPLFGTWNDGMMCGATTTLPNGAYRYCFYAEDDEGAIATGDPTAWCRGPKLIGPPQLWCTGLPGRESDYLHPETGIAGETRFKFTVQCTDGEGDRPIPHRICLERKRADGTWGGFCNEIMATWGGGLRSGKYYNLSRKLRAGEYRYRFVFADDDGPATGSDSAGPDGTQWQPGPVVSEATADAIASSGGTMVTSLAAMPSPGGTEIVFSLSAPMAVDARVLNIAGRPVKTLCRARHCEAGSNTLLWNAMSDQGLPVPNGTYLIGVMAKADDGAQARALAQVRVRR